MKSLKAFENELRAVCGYGNLNVNGLFVTFTNLLLIFSILDILLESFK